MKKILVTTDFSSSSKSAIRFAIQLSSQIKCELVFYYVLEGIEGNIWEANSKDKADRSSESFSKTEKLKKFINLVYKSNNVKMINTSYVIETGFDIPELIKSYANKNNFDYICIGTRGGGLLKKILGTNTSTLIQHSLVPVFVIPKNYRTKPIKDIWYASDLGNLKNELMNVQVFARQFKADVHVYHYDYMIELNEVLSKLNKIASKYIFHR